MLTAAFKGLNCLGFKAGLKLVESWFKDQLLVAQKLLYLKRNFV
jgi:hypothetical protein